MADVPLSLAIGPYDHVRDVLDGSVPVAGADLTVLRLPIEEIFFRFTFHREFDVSEMSFAKIVSLASQDDNRIVPLPVFPSRVLRHSSVYVRADSPLTELAALAGKRVGVPEWAQTAAVYSRGMLARDHGVELASIHWHQAGLNEAGRVEKVKLRLPEGLRLTVVRDRSLTQLLLDGDLDAVLSARPPAPVLARDGRVRRLLADPRAAEESYLRRTGIFPIMHVVALRRDVHERHPWLAMNLYKAFDEAKRRSVERAADITASFLPLPWTPALVEESQALLGADPWPYGIEPNRPTLEAFLRYAFEQGVCHRLLTPEELFPPEVSSRYKV